MAERVPPLLEDEEDEDPPPLTVITKSRKLWHPLALVWRAVYVALDENVRVISRAVDVKPLGPVHHQDPPVVGCGPNFTVLPAVTVAVDVCCHVPPLTCRYGVIAVGVQPLLLDEELLELEDDELLEDELPVPLTVI